jgi:serine protease Do
MRKLGIWGGPILVTMMLVAGVAGPAAGPALAQDQKDQQVPWLGVMTQSLDDGLREGLDYEGEGVLVSRVVSNSPASRAGIRKGDILLSMNSRRVSSPSQLTDLIRSARAGQSVSIALMRSGERRTVNVQLAERPDNVGMPDSELDDLRDLPRMMSKDFDKDMHKHSGTYTYTFRGPSRGRLGVRVESLKGDLGAYFDAPEDKGVLILEVMDDSPAEKAGLKAGDVITEVGGHKVSDYDDLADALRDRDEGNVSITVMRKGNRRTVQAELEDVPAPMWVGQGHDMTIIRPRSSGTRSRSSSGDSEELRQLREEVKELREKLQNMEDDDKD